MLDGGRRKKRARDAQGLTIIGQGTAVKGEIHSTGTVRIEGQVTGTVHCEGAIVVQESGQVAAELVGSHVIISGKVKGNVFAHERLEVMANATVIGDITSPRISIAEGVVFEGQCIMKTPAEAASTPAELPPGRGPEQETPAAEPPSPPQSE